MHFLYYKEQIEPWRRMTIGHLPQMGVLIDLDIEFNNKVLHTPVHVKMDSPDQLLLLESACM